MPTSESFTALSYNLFICALILAINQITASIASAATTSVGRPRVGDVFTFCSCPVYGDNGSTPPPDQMTEVINGSDYTWQADVGIVGPKDPCTRQCGTCEVLVIMTDWEEPTLAVPQVWNCGRIDIEF